MKWQRYNDEQLYQVEPALILTSPSAPSPTAVRNSGARSLLPLLVDSAVIVEPNVLRLRHLFGASSKIL